MLDDAIEASSKLNAASYLPPRRTAPGAEL